MLQLPTVAFEVVRFSVKYIHIKNNKNNERMLKIEGIVQKTLCIINVGDVAHYIILTF